MRHLSRTEDRRLKKAACVFMLSVVLIVDGVYFIDSLKDMGDSFGALLLAINVLTIVAVFGLFFLGTLVNPDKLPIAELINSFMIAVVGTSFACVSLVSFVFVFSSNSFMPGSKGNATIAFFSSVAILGAFVYYAYVHQHL